MLDCFGMTLAFACPGPAWTIQTVLILRLGPRADVETALLVSLAFHNATPPSAFLDFETTTVKRQVLLYKI